MELVLYMLFRFLQSLVSEKTVNLLDGTDELGRIVLFQTSPNTTLTNISSENVGTYSWPS